MNWKKHEKEETILAQGSKVSSGGTYRYRACDIIRLDPLLEKEKEKKGGKPRYFITGIDL